tara:strand:+ start:412 stop:630 length:219 start_codon:yes stop_codon:yes gene_type:complete
LNPHALRRQNLNLVRLPISPHPLVKIQKYLQCPYQKDIEDSRAKTNFLKKFLGKVFIKSLQNAYFLSKVVKN